MPDAAIRRCRKVGEDMNDATQPDIIELVSSLDFAATLARIEDALTQAGLMIFARIDHAAGARDAGLQMPPATVLIYGHAKGGTPIMLAAPQTALDLPLRVLVRQADNGSTIVAYHPIAPLLVRAGITPEMAARLEPAQRLLANSMA
jgi:uncharacterized protein (DUF302 family)